MTDHRAPLKDMRFVLAELVDYPAIAGLPGYEEATLETVDAILDEGAKLAEQVIGPLNRVGDKEGSRLENGVVRTPTGFKDAYGTFIAGGWQGVPFDPAHGGQGLPWTLNAAVTEMWDAASTAFALCPMLTAGAIEAISHHGTDEQKRLFLPKLVSGEWSGTMNLTEPQAGSDVGALRSKAVRDGDGFRIFGQKIFITYGDQDYTDNVVHLVLARIEGAPPGVKGISLFLVPKVRVNADGSLGPRNDLRPVSLEHKLGIHASPTAVMAYGENGGAHGTLIGRENDGMACMFTMMNNARLNVGLLGLGTAERAWQQARAFARERVQGRDIVTGENDVRIVRHPDVRRMLAANIYEEDTGGLSFGRSHPELFHEMMQGLGFDIAAFQRAKLLPASAAYRAWLERATAHRDWVIGAAGEAKPIPSFTCVVARQDSRFVSLSAYS